MPTEQLCAELALAEIPPSAVDLRAQARAAVHRAVQLGELERPERCPLCDQPRRIDGHHEDYGAPLEVDWRCDRCHAHGHIGRAPACPIGYQVDAVVYVDPRPRGIQVCWLALLELERRRQRPAWAVWANLRRLAQQGRRRAA